MLLSDGTHTAGVVSGRKSIEREGEDHNRQSVFFPVYKVVCLFFPINSAASFACS